MVTRIEAEVKQRNYIGSAHIAGIMGIEGSYGSEYSIAQELRTGESVFDNDDLPEPISLGIELENYVLRAYAKKEKAEIIEFQPHYRSRVADSDCLGATPDALVQSVDGTLRLVDAKVVGDWKWHEVPPRYEASSQWQLGNAVNCGVDVNECDLAVYHLPARRLAVYRITFNKTWFDEAADFAVGWFNAYVRDGHTPPIDGSTYTSDALRKVRADIGKSSNIDHLKPLIDLHNRYSRIVKWADDRASQMINTLCDALGTSEVGLIDGKPAFTWKEQKGQTRIDSTALKADMPDIYERYAKQGNAYRVHRFVKTKKGK